MKTEKELNADILTITLTIQEKFPELSKYIAEMPVTVLDTHNPEINSKHLQNYFDSLSILLKKYSENHDSIAK